MPTVTDETTAPSAADEAPEQESPQQKAARTRKQRKSYTMTDDHKEALAEGRREGAAVRAYLESISDHAPMMRRSKKRGRKPATDSREGIERRLKVIDETMPNVNPLHRLQLVQERMDLQRKLDVMQLMSNGRLSDDAREALEERFILHAKGYAQRHGISYRAFREVGVPADVLKKAGIPRGDMPA